MKTYRYSIPEGAILPNCSICGKPLKNKEPYVWISKPHVGFLGAETIAHYKCAQAAGKLNLFGE